jgi:hypothetical protein
MYFWNNPSREYIYRADSLGPTMSTSIVRWVCVYDCRLTPDNAGHEVIKDRTIGLYNAK